MYLLKDYDDVLKRILDEGELKPNRTGVDTLSLFGVQCRYKIDEFFPLPTKRKYAFKSIFAELLWMLSGSTSVKDLEAMGSKIWSAWRSEAFEKENGYMEGDLGPIYGFQMRNFGANYSDKIKQEKLDLSLPGAKLNHVAKGFDQVEFIINELINNRFSRRIMMNLWNPADVLNNKIRLPPCHYSFQLLVDSKYRLTGILNQRSGDWLPGVSANIFFYSAFMYMIAQQTGLQPYELVHNVADSHIYVNQLDAAKEYLSRPQVDSPKLELNQAKSIFDYTLDDFKILDYNPLASIKVPVAV